jgi:hypothetical protein
LTFRKTRHLQRGEGIATVLKDKKERKKERKRERERESEKEIERKKE